jgi:hypothetical protein
MVTCGFCGHPGTHATITTTYGGVQYCTGCRYCQIELQRKRQAAETEADRNDDSGQEGAGG